MSGSGEERTTRRGFLAGAASAAAGLAAPAVAQGRARVVVIGGGPGGARAARLLSQSSGAVDVALVNAQPVHMTGAFSNHYLAGLRSLRSLTHALAPLAETGARLVVDRVVGVDRGGRAVRLAGGDALDYDRLVLAPGISFQQAAVVGYDAVASQSMPHAYAGGFQAYLLKRRLLDLREGGVFAIAAPPDPARCAPAPYERASLIAAVLARSNPRAKVLIFDAKDDFPHRARYEEFWAENYGDMIAWRPASFIGGGVVGVDSREMTVRLGSGDVVRVDAASVSPPQQAAAVAFLAGVVDGGGWAPVDPETMRSTIDPMVFVIGDCARLDPMPKTASAALAQAGRCASAILSELGADAPPPPPLADELWSFADALISYKSGATYQSGAGGLRVASRVESAIPSDNRARLDQSLEMSAWYRRMVAQTYG